MKLIILMYLEEDESNVEALLRNHGIEAYSQVCVEGHGKGSTGWYGSVPPYASRMTIVAVEESKATELLTALSSDVKSADPRHPIHAMQMAIEACTDSGPAPGHGHDGAPGR